MRRKPGTRLSMSQGRTRNWAFTHINDPHEDEQTFKHLEVKYLQDILTVLNTFSFQHPFPQLRKAQCFPPSQAVKKRSEIKLVSISASSLTKHPSHTSSLLSRPTSPSPAIRGRQFPQQLTGQTHESSFQSRLCRAEVSERCPYDWRLVNVNDNPTFPSDKDLKTLVEPAFRANNNKNVVLCGHSTDDIVTHRFLTSSVVDQSWIDTYIFAVITSGAPFVTVLMDRSINHQHSDTGSRLSARMIPNKNTFDDDCVNMTWTDNKAGKACVKTAVQRTRNNTDQPLVLPKVMTHVMYSIGINATAGVILNATSQRWSSDTHSDYYMDGDGTVPTVSLSITPLVERHLAHFYGTEDKIEDARIHPSHITTSHSITPECLSETKSCSWPSGPGQTSSLSTIDAATVEFEHQDSPNVAANQ
ncbi:hypothetical protein BLNAU_4536 [Blattamonas nauphoetae]|uniref:Uncharacterized protein n=1 Tax=Blattamonas nauphoetae TaxID=2049346 RepID=A0ABQ9Y9D6_9EUKA|nr:hypothetical protein BLNAU_4536 [Blattamonas nauphoetae]